MLEQLVKTGVRRGLLGTFVSYPALVESFNPVDQRITAQVAIMQIINGVDTPLAILVDIPIVLPTVQGFHITMPVKMGDEVLLVFADRCYDSWFNTGKVSVQTEHRVHSPSDGFAMIGINSEPNVITDYATDAVEIRNTEGDQKIRLDRLTNLKVGSFWHSGVCRYKDICPSSVCRKELRLHSHT